MGSGVRKFEAFFKNGALISSERKAHLFVVLKHLSSLTSETFCCTLLTCKKGKEMCTYVRTCKE